MTTDPKRRIARIRAPEVPEPADGRFSNCLLVDGIAYIAGMTSREGDNVYAQAKNIFEKIKLLVERAGGTIADVVKITVYVVDIKKNTEVWRARREFFTGDFPASTLVEVRSLTKDVLVEIETIAYLGKS